MHAFSLSIELFFFVFLLFRKYFELDTYLPHIHKHIMSSIIKRLPSTERLQQVKKITAEIFGANWNPTNARNGAKILRQPLKGPEVASYYGVNEATPSFKDFKEWFPELKLVDPKEAYRLKMVEDRKKRNKGAPKKKSK